MMINKRLIGTVRESRKYIAGNVILQWCSLGANIMMMICIARILTGLYDHTAGRIEIYMIVLTAAAAVLVRFLCTVWSNRMGYLSSRTVKKTLRELIYQKLLRLGTSYQEQVQTSEIVQVAVEGVDQLETYFAAYLPQFFYAMLAPLTLFVVLSFVNLPSALVLLVCVPLIPIAIAAVQTWAKKLLAVYWGQYTALGDSFLENLQGLTTLKIYQTDGLKHEEMNRESEQFRRITMKVLSMQLNSITIMDLIAYGGAALGAVMAITQLQRGQVNLWGAVLIILLAADFFIPMRQLGSFFHIAMNGMAASDKIFRLLDMPEPEKRNGRLDLEELGICCENLGYSYEKEREILHGVNMSFPKGSFTALVGESGCGKSTIAAVLMGRNRGYTGHVSIGDVSRQGQAADAIELKEASEESLMKSFTYVSHKSCLFQGTVRDNLLMGNPGASEKELWDVLDTVRLSAFLKEEQGLDTILKENGVNLSGGQRQRLALARALLHDSPVYIFDEATSNIDVESENDIMEQIQCLARRKTVILISHRLANVVSADWIYVLEQGNVAEEGTHEALLQHHGVYEKLWNTQQSLEKYGKEGSLS